MRHLAIFIFLSLFTAITSFAQTGSVQGKLIDSETAEPVENILVQVIGANIEVYTNQNGEFLLNNVPVGEGALTFTKEDYELKELAFNLSESDLLDIGSITIVYRPFFELTTEEIPVVVIEDSELDDESSQSMSGLLHSSGDIFSSVAAYTFGPARFRVRGYESENSYVYMNGIKMNDLENGQPYWYEWGGLNDAVRNRETVDGLSSSTFSVPVIGGVSNMITRASEYPVGVKTSYANAMGNYKNRIMLTASTGMMDNGWAVTFSGSRRWAEEGYVEGTFYDAWSYFLAIEKRINSKHSLNITAFGAYQNRGKLNGSTQEAYDEYGSNFYNSNWGYQNGEVRNSRVANNHKPAIILNHIWDLSEKTKITTSVAYKFGYSGGTALNWYGVGDPRPDYYKYLPYYNRDYSTYEGWTNQHVNWDEFYFINGKNYDAVYEANGIAGNTVTGNRSAYIVENRLISQNRITANTLIHHELNENIKLKGGLEYDWYKGSHYKEIDDLLGGDYYLDIDNFAERDNITSDSSFFQSDLNNPHHVVYEGDRFGYDYDANITKYGAWAQSDLTFGNLDAYFAANVTNTSFFRTGNMRTGKFPEESYGDSEKQNFTNFQLNGGATYKITGRHIVSANLLYMTRAPYFEDAYISPITRDHVVNNLKSETIYSADLNYVIRTPLVNGRITGYYTKFNDQTDIMRFYSDGERSFVNFVMTNIDKQHFGTEIGLEVKPTSELSINGVLAMGQNTYTSRPQVSIATDNQMELNIAEQTVYYKNYYVEGSPQTAASVGIKYNSPKFWWAEANMSYYDDNYLSMNPLLRTSTAIEGLDPNTEYGAQKIDEIVRQEKVPSAYILNVSGGKSWKIDKYYISLHASVNNVLNNQEFITGGYEQLRFDNVNRDLDKFPSKYFYMYGTTYYLILTFRF